MNSRRPPENNRRSPANARLTELQRRRSRRNAAGHDEVSQQNGLRWFFLALLVAMGLGWSFRAALSPKQVKAIAEEALTRIAEASPELKGIQFASARLSLAKGAWPEFALVFERIEWQAPQTCPEFVPVRAKSIRLPLSVGSLLRSGIEGDFASALALGEVALEDFVIDVDEVKRSCASPVSGANAASGAGPSPVTIRQVLRATGETVRDTLSALPVEEAGATTQASKFWRTEDFDRIRPRIQGIRIDRAEVIFERRSKSVVIEDLQLNWREYAGGEPGFQLKTRLRLPPPTVYGENLPPFQIQGDVRASIAELDVRAELNEGSLSARAQLKPVELKAQRDLLSEVVVELKNLPLSILTPLFHKASIVEGAFQPKFVWLDCQASVAGLFQKMLVEQPVKIRACEVSGQLGRIRVDEALRLPSGSWSPFTMKIQAVSLARLIETFDLKVPKGVVQDPGQFDGQVVVSGPQAAVLEGQWTRLHLAVQARGQHVQQKLQQLKTRAELSPRGWQGELSEIALEEGEFSGQIAWSFDRSLQNGRLQMNFSQLRLSPRVERVMWGGPVAKLKGQIEFALRDLGLVDVQAQIEARELNLDEFEAPRLELEASRGREAVAGKGPPQVRVVAKASDLAFRRSGTSFQNLRPALLGWEGPGGREFLKAQDVQLRGTIENEGFRWDKLQMTLGQGVGRVTLSSRGSVSRLAEVDQEITADYPAARHLVWGLKGSWYAPQWRPISSELKQLLSRSGSGGDAETPQDDLIRSAQMIEPRRLGLP